MDLGLQMETGRLVEIPPLRSRLQYGARRRLRPNLLRHQATMRSTSLRLLGAIAAKFGLKMRRWDFTAAYLSKVPSRKVK